MIHAVLWNALEWSIMLYLWGIWSYRQYSVHLPPLTDEQYIRLSVACEYQQCYFWHLHKSWSDSDASTVDKSGEAFFNSHVQHLGSISYHCVDDLCGLNCMTWTIYGGNAAEVKVARVTIVVLGNRS